MSDVVKSRSVLFLFLILSVLLLVTLGSRGLNEPDEGRYGEIAREMWVTGDYLVPRIKGVPHYAKPPLTYWAVAGSLALLGCDEWVFRLPGALASILVLVLLYDWGRREFGRRAGVIACLGLASCLMFSAMQRILTTDMIMTAWVVTAYWAHARIRMRVRETGPEGRGCGWFAALFWVALGLAFLTKGPVPVLIVLFGLLGAYRGLGGFRSTGWLWGLPLFAVIAASWYGLLFRLDPSLADDLISKELGARVSRGLGRSKPFWYFLPVIVIGTMPWTLLVFRALRAGRGWSRELDENRQLSLRLAWHGVFWSFVMFSLSASKLWTYMTPLLPLLSLYVAAWIDESLRRSDAWSASWPWPNRFRPHQPRWLIRQAFVFLVLIQFLLVGVEFKEKDLGHNTSYRDLYESLLENQGSSGILGADLVGAKIPLALEPETEVPIYPRGGLAVLSYRFRSPSASIYLMGERAEYLPNFGGDSLWEFEHHREQHRVPLVGDLEDLLRQRGRVLVVTKAKYLAELRRVLKRGAKTIAAQGTGKNLVMAVLFEVD